MNHNGDNEEWLDEVPMMFRAQTEGRCQLQRVENNESKEAGQWVKEWTKFHPQPARDRPQIQDSSVPVWKRRPSKPQPKTQQDPPKFGAGVVTRPYTLSWRLATNSGQDETIIRPVIGAKGYPYYPGSSMKGAFSRACSKKQRERYCGKALSEKELAELPAGSLPTQPGILRFHGGYPVDTSWTQNLIDVIHPQEEKQVIDHSTTGAKVQISLHRAKMRFGISSPHLAEGDPEWETIWNIWEKALGQGLGSRVSAGYGRFEDCPLEQVLLEVHLQGQGLASTLLDGKPGTPELRPNMFKAALRGHTLRLLGGMTNAETAKKLTQILWGGIEGENPVVGLLGVAFHNQDNPTQIFDFHQYREERRQKVVKMPVYNLKKGVLTIFNPHNNFNSHDDLTETQQEELKELAEALIQFSMLLGGFGKSWRRVDHRIFHPSYLGEGDIKRKPMIGCHWKFGKESQPLYIPVSEDLTEIAEFIDKVRDRVRTWASQQENLGNTIASNWREAWYKDGVQVWGRIAAKGSKAVRWFHQENFLKNSSLGGSMGRTGRVWHRMYPLHSLNDRGDLEVLPKQYLELLTIFPDRSQKSNDFLKSLRNSSNTIGNFQHLW